MSGAAAPLLAHSPVQPIDVSQVRPRWSIDPDDWEQVSRLVAILTIHPILSLATYFFPIFGAITSNYSQVYREDIAQQAKIPEETKNNLFKNVDALVAAAGIRRKVGVFTGLVNYFDSFGGLISITSPLFVMPNHRLLRPNGINYGSEVPERDRLSENTWLLSDDETSFCISRELAHIKHNDALMRVLAKVGIVAAAFFTYFGFIGILTGIAIGFVAIVLFIISERCFQAKMDTEGVKILAAYFNNQAKEAGKEITPELKLQNEVRAANIAIRVFQKQQQVNLARRAASFFTRIYIAKNTGNNWASITNPLGSTRIARLEKYRDQLLAAPA